MAEEVTKVVEDVDKLFSEIVVNGESHVSDRYTPPEPAQSTPVSTNQEEEETPVQTQEPVQGQYVEAVNLNNVIHDFKDAPLTEEVTAIQQAITALQGRLNELVTAINGINAKIPAQASAQNQLADKNFVNSSIATNTANFLGTYTTLAEIEAIPNPTNNDYAFLETTDSAGNTLYDRYKYSGEDEEWLFEYELNNSGFTAEQWATINSGITEVSDTVQSGDNNPVTSDAVYQTLQLLAGIPVGFIMPQYKKVNQAGWLYLDGRDTTGTSDELETIYPALYAYLGNTNVLPDYRELALVGAEQNTTDTIATHDVYTEGQFKDDALQNINGRFSIRNMQTNASATTGYIDGCFRSETYDSSASSIQSASSSGKRTEIKFNSKNSTRNDANADVTRGKRKAVFFYIKATN